MQDLTYINHFSFHKVHYTEYHQANFAAARYNFVMYMQKGIAEILTENELLSLQEGEALYIPQGAKYSVALRGEPDILFGSYAFMNYPDKQVKASKIQKIDCTPDMLEHIKIVFEANGVNCSSVGNFYLFLSELHKRLTPLKADKKQLLLERAMSFMVRNPDCSVKETARYCNVSESALYALFAERSHVTPAIFRLHAKLERAVDYLVSTDIPIEEISSLCGFSSSSYFRKKLFSVYKKTPSQIRKTGVGEVFGF